VGEAEHALADDVALHLGGATADLEGLGEQEAVVPRARFRAEGTGVGEHACRAGQVLGQVHDRLAVAVGQRLADGRLRTGRFSLDRRGDRSQPDETEDLALDVELGQSLPEQLVGGATLLAHEVDEIERARPSTP
jgi:hypothetical protein